MYRMFDLDLFFFESRSCSIVILENCSNGSIGKSCQSRYNIQLCASIN